MNDPLDRLRDALADRYGIEPELRPGEAFAVGEQVLFSLRGVPFFEELRAKVPR